MGLSQLGESIDVLFYKKKQALNQHKLSIWQCAPSCVYKTYIIRAAELFTFNFSIPFFVISIVLHALIAGEQVLVIIMCGTGFTHALLLQNIICDKELITFLIANCKYNKCKVWGNPQSKLMLYYRFVQQLGYMDCQADYVLGIIM